MAGFKVVHRSLRGYQFLFKRKQHVQGTLQLMADWNLDSFLSKLTLVQNPIQFVTGANDKTPHRISEWAKRIASAEFIEFGVWAPNSRRNPRIAPLSLGGFESFGN